MVVLGVNFYLFGIRLYFYANIGGGFIPKFRSGCLELAFWRVSGGKSKSWLSFDLLPSFLTYSI